MFATSKTIGSAVVARAYLLLIVNACNIHASGDSNIEKYIRFSLDSRKTFFEGYVSRTELPSHTRRRWCDIVCGQSGGRFRPCRKMAVPDPRSKCAGNNASLHILPKPKFHTWDTRPFFFKAAVEFFLFQVCACSRHSLSSSVLHKGGSVSLYLQAYQAQTADPVASAGLPLSLSLSFMAPTPHRTRVRPSPSKSKSPRRRVCAASGFDSDDDEASSPYAARYHVSVRSAKVC